jgi:hypothetical protein
MKEGWKTTRKNQKIKERNYRIGAIRAIRAIFILKEGISRSIRPQTQGTS